jgi:hypothetical protein
MKPQYFIFYSKFQPSSGEISIFYENSCKGSLQMDYGKNTRLLLKALCACVLAMVIELLDRHLILLTYKP